MTGVYIWFSLALCFFVRSVINEVHACCTKDHGQVNSSSFLKIGRQGKELESTLGALFPRNETSHVSQTRTLDHPSNND
jgi:hypothetical protein